MNKAELVDAIASKTGSSKKAAEAALNATIEAISASLKKGDKVQLVGFGSFEVRKRAARKGRIHKQALRLRSLHQKLHYSKLEKLLKRLLINNKRTLGVLFFLQKETGP